MRRRTALVAALLAAGVAGLVLWRRAPGGRMIGAPLPVAYDLAALAPVAEHGCGGTLVVFGTAAAQPYEGRGILAAAGDAAADPHVMLRRRADLLLDLPEAADRIALLDLAPLPGLGGQTVVATLDEAEVGRIALAEGRRRYAIALPAAKQRTGRHVLGLLFEKVGERQTDFRLKLAARLFALALLPAKDALLVNALLPGAPPILSSSLGGYAPPSPPVSTPTPVPTVTQVGPSTLTYTVMVPRDGRLRFTPQRTEPGRVRARVTIAAAGRPTRELWSAAVDRAAPSDEIDVALPEGPARVTLEVAPEKDAAGAWVSWKAPRIVAVGAAADPLFARPGPRATAPAIATPGASPSRAVDGVVLVILDAAGAAHFSSYGYARATTPEVDRLAREGVLFEDATSPAGYTLLAMGTIWTSQLPNEHHNGIPPAARLPRDILTLADLLAAQGVQTAGFIANAMAGRGFGLERGFQHFEEMYRTHGGRGAFAGAIGAWTAAHRDRPFFVYAHFREPHFPYDPGPPYETAFGPDGPLSHEVRKDPRWVEDVNGGRVTLDAAEREHLVRLYDGNLQAVDAEVGRLRKALEAEGLWDRTAVIVTADHGEALLEHGALGHEGQVEREVTHIPLVLRLPGGPVGRRVDGLVDLTDVAPTIAEMLGVSGRGGSDRSFRGRSLLDRLRGAPGKPFAVSRTPGLQPRYALRHERWTYHTNTRLGTEALYDLAQDPGERQDVSARERWRTAYYRQAVDWFVTAHRRLSRSSVEEGVLTPEQRENLRALGYLN